MMKPYHAEHHILKIKGGTNMVVILIIKQFNTPCISWAARNLLRYDYLNIIQDVCII